MRLLVELWSQVSSQCKEAPLLTWSIGLLAGLRPDAKIWGLLEIISNWKLEGKNKTKTIAPNPWPGHTARSPKIFKENQSHDSDPFRKALQQNQPILKTLQLTLLKRELKLIHFTWKRNRKSRGCPGRQCPFKLRNTSLTQFDLLYPILELWHKVQSSSQWEKYKCGYKNQTGRDLSEETAE